jgi:hypothetical protein
VRKPEEMSRVREQIWSEARKGDVLKIISINEWKDQNHFTLPTSWKEHSCTSGPPALQTSRFAKKLRFLAS